MRDDDDPPEGGECHDAELEITTSYESHVVLFREFADATNGWLTHYEQVMAPMIMKCLSGDSEKVNDSDWQLMSTLTRHAENFARLVQDGLAEYEEAMKTARAIFSKRRR